MERTARLVHVSGRVQGVGFRWYVQNAAQEHRVSGWVRNLHDGRVEAWIEGEGGSVAAMVAALRRGPPGARVDAVEAREREPEGSEGFEVRRAGF